MLAKTIICAIISAKRLIIKEIRELKQEVRQMALDTSRLQEAVARLAKASEALLASHAAGPDLTPVQQTLDAQVTALDIESTKMEAAVAPLPVVAPAA
jgi:hypothetical protein